MKIYHSILQMLDVLGVEYKPTILDDEALKLFNSWNEAKAQKDFDKADVYRKQLMDKGLL